MGIQRKKRKEKDDIFTYILEGITRKRKKKKDRPRGDQKKKSEIKSGIREEGPEMKREILKYEKENYLKDLNKFSKYFIFHS